MSGGAQPAQKGSSTGGSLAAVAPILANLMKQQPTQAAPMGHPMPGQAQPMAPMPAPPMSGAPMPGGGGGLLGGMGGSMPAPGGMPGGGGQIPPQLQQMLMQRGLLGGMGNGGQQY